MKKHDGSVRGFYHLSKAWYGKGCLESSDILDEVMFGFYHKDGGTTGEMSMRWKELGGKEVPKLEVFDDGWHALNEFKDVIQKLADVDNLNINPEQFCEILLDCGFENLTPEKERS